LPTRIPGTSRHSSVTLNLSWVQVRHFAADAESGHKSLAHRAFAGCGKWRCCECHTQRGDQSGSLQVSIKRIERADERARDLAHFLV
jgi:hypothetical protein